METGSRRGPAGSTLARESRFSGADVGDGIGGPVVSRDWAVGQARHEYDGKNCTDTALIRGRTSLSRVFKPITHVSKVRAPTTVHDSWR